MQLLRPGGMMVIPSGRLHCGLALDDDVALQEVGIGPTGTYPSPKAPNAPK